MIVKCVLGRVYKISCKDTKKIFNMQCFSLSIYELLLTQRDTMQ